MARNKAKQRRAGARRNPATRPSRMPAYWWREPVKRPKVCYPSKSAALREFLDANWQIVEGYGGIDYEQSPSEFDSVNHKYGLTGKNAARSIAQALWAAMPSGQRPYCIEDIDLDALNDTSPAKWGVTDDQGRAVETPFVLPAHVEESRLMREYEKHYRSLAEGESMRENPSSMAAVLGDVAWTGAGYYGARYATRAVASRVPVSATYQRPAAAAAILFAATYSGGLLGAHRARRVSAGAALNLLDAIVASFAPDTVKSAVGVAYTPVTSSAPTAGY